MNIIRKALTTLGGILFAALLIAALAPKATRGIAAALVQVTNTGSNAVPTFAGPGSFPFGATLCANTLNTVCGTSTPSFVVPLTTSTGAAVTRLVIEDVSAHCDMDQGDAIWPSINVPLPADSVMAGPSTLQYHFPVTPVGGPIGTVSGVTHSPARIYADPGALIETQVSGFFADTHGASCNIFLSGHLETK
jgi:hypothetical protein